MAIPQGWQPTLSKSQVRFQLDKWKGRAEQLDEKAFQDLELHAQHYNIPFYPGDFSLLEAIKQAGAGFVEGFTTLEVADHPDNEYEQIFRNLGHLLGFAPNMTAAPLKMFGARAMASKIANIRSGPMWVADKARDLAGQQLKSAGIGFTGRSEALKTTKKFYLGEAAEHITEGAFHLGVASGVSAWKGGIDEMMHGFIGGAQAGGGFRLIGNLIPGTAAHDKVAKAFAGSLYQGLPATQRGATTPEQVYEYALGAFFGGNEVSWSRAGAQKFIKKMVEKGQADKKWATTSGMDPEFHPEFHDLPEPVKPILKEMAKETFGDHDMNRAMGFLLASEMGEGEKITDQALKIAGFEKTDEYVDGERVYKLSESGAKKYKSFVMSGGAEGADKAWAETAAKVGIPTVHYTFGKHSGKVKGPGFKRVLYLSELEDANADVTKANETLGRDLSKTSEYKMNLFRRNAYQVRYADAVYAVGELMADGKRVKGGTGWGVQMGIDQGKPVYLFDQAQNRWYQFNQGADRFTPLKGLPPRPPARFAGIGSRNLKDNGERAIKDVMYAHYTKTENVTSQVKLTKKQQAEQKKTSARLIEVLNEKDGIEKEMNEKAGEIELLVKGGKELTEADVKRLEEPLLQLREKHDKLVEEEMRLTNKNATLADMSTPESDTITAKYNALVIAKEALDDAKSRITKEGDNIRNVKLKHRENENSKKEGSGEASFQAIEREFAEFRNLFMARKFKEMEAFELSDLAKEGLRTGQWEKYKKNVMEFATAEESLRVRESELKLEKNRSAKKANEEVADVEDIDKEVLGNLRIGKRSLQFADAWLSDLWKGNPIPAEATVQKALVANKVKEILEPFIRKGSKENLSEEWADNVESELSQKSELNPTGAIVKLDAGARGEMRQWLTRKNTGKLVTHLRSDGTKITRMGDDSNPVSGAGNRKHQEDPVKRIEVTYKEQGGGDDPAYMVLDHITVKTDKGNRDLDLSQFRNNHLKKQFKSAEKAEEYYNKFLANAMTEMANKGYYYFGGRGDGNKMFWVKYHPMVEKNAKSKKYLDNKIEEIIIEGLKKDSNFRDDFAEVKTDFIAKYKKGRTREEVEQMFDMNYLSNVYYELSMNNLSINKKNISKILTKGDFINDSKGYNKRAQIWFSNGWAGDKQFIKSELMGEVDVPGKLIKSGQDIEAEYQKYIREPNPDEFGNNIVRIDNFKKYDKKGRLIRDDFNDDLARVQFANTKYGGRRVYDDAAGVFVDLFEKPTKQVKSLLNDNDNYNYIIAKDLADSDAKLNHNMVKLLNNQLPEHVDGAILVRDDVLRAMNKDFGTVSSTGQNKSFIVSPHATHGALLGKFMFHSVGKEMSQMMKDKGLHMIMQESAVKQKGTRNIGDYSIDKNGLNLKKSDIYELSPEEVLGSFGVYGSDHMVGKQRIPKQLLSNLIRHAFAKVDQKVIDNAFEEIIGNRWKGEDKWNNELDIYLDRLSSGRATRTELEFAEEAIVKNIEKIGMHKLVDALKNEYADGLNEKLYSSILRLDKNFMEEQYRDGEITQSEFKSYNENVSEFTSVVDRVLKSANEWADSQRAEGRDVSASSIYMHKFVRDFRMKAVQNFLVNSATKPSRDNSLSAFMRPYDKGLQANLGSVNELLARNNVKGLNHNDNLFFLDAAFANTSINTDLTGRWRRTTLGSLWKEYTKPKSSFNAKEKAYLKEVFRAVTMRVPMDSMSGAQVLEFGGFTGREGHGILLHGRAMRAEGGADLDGDKAFVFFGGRNGMKKDWKDAYAANKEEFYYEEGGERYVGDNKKSIIPGTKDLTYEDLLTEEMSKSQKRKYNSLAYQYASNERMRISNAAVDGRGQLGPAVVNKQTMAAAYNSIMASGGEDSYSVWTKDGKGYKEWQITIRARDSKGAQEVQRGMGRAQVAFGSDPLDVLGLKSSTEWYKNLWGAHFDVSSVKSRTGKGKFKNVEITGELMDMFVKDPNKWLKGGVIADYSNLNKAYWGRNWEEGRKYEMHEIHQLGSSIHNIGSDPRRMNNIFAKTGELFQGLDWSDSVFGRLDRDMVTKVYTEYQNSMEKYDWLQGLLGRSSFEVDMGKYIKSTMKYNLWNEKGLRETAKSTAKFQDAVRGTLFGKKKELILEALRDNTLGKEKRKDVLRQIARLGEDFLVNDMTDIASIRNISRVLDKMVAEGDIGMTAEGMKRRDFKDIIDVVSNIHGKVEFLKKRSYLMARDRKNLKIEDLAKSEDLEMLSKKQREQLDEWYADIWGDDVPLTEADKAKTPKRGREMGEDITAEMDQATIDAEIVKYKNELTDSGKQLFDQLMLGSLNRGDLNKIDDIVKNVKKWDPVTIDVLHNLRSQASKTSVSRLGFSSNNIGDIAVKEHLGSYLDLFQDMQRKPTGESIDKAINSINKATAKQENKSEGLPDTPFEEFITENTMHSGYEGLKKGQLDAPTKQIVMDIATMLKTYNNKVGQNLGEIVRGLDFIGKDLNAMNKVDFVNLRNWLSDMKRGSFVQRMFGNKGPTKLAKRHWSLFPEAINRELMRDELVLMRERGFFTDRYGDVKEGPIVRPTNYIDIVQNWISKMSDQSTGTADRYIKQFQEKMQFHTGTEDASALWQVAIRKRELKYKHEIINSDRSPAEKEAAINELHIREGEIRKETKYDTELRDKEYWLSVPGEGRVKLTGREIVQKINSNLTDVFKEMHQFITGEPGALKPYITGYYDPVTQLAPIIDYKKFIRHLQIHQTGGPSPWKDVAKQDIPTKFGIDGLRAVSRSMMLDMMKTDSKEAKKYKEEISKQPLFDEVSRSTEQVFKTGKIDFEAYFPHMFFETKEASTIMNKAVKKLLETPLSEFDSDPEKAAAKRDAEMKKIVYRHKALEGDWQFKDMEEFEMFDDVMQQISDKKRVSDEQIKWFNANERAGSMHTRSTMTSGWSIDPAVVEAYIRSLSNTYYRQMSNMMSRHVIDKMGKEMYHKWGGEQTKAWQTFMQLYAQDAMGNPSNVPQHLIDNPNMKLKGTPYAWWADNKVRDKVNKIADKLGILNKDLPENLRGIDFQTLRNWSNLEAQFQMASLLAHPKSMVANIFGGTMHTIQNVGFGKYTKSFDYNFLSKINPEWTNKEAVDKFVISQGVLPEYMLYEFGLQKEYQNAKGKQFLSELSSKLQRNPDMDATTIGEIASKYGKGWKDKAVNFAAKFMTAPERMLRRQSFMAHYIQAWEMFGGQIKEFDHPFIIEMAKKGVKSTQFLYNAPNRPAFARTALGKVMSRFQLWAWNSVRFRNDVKRQGRMMGFMPGTDAAKRYERQVRTDMFSFALANMFAYSLFESNLPQPYGWYQDMADWVFGDEKERDKAFYGAYPTSVAPLQAITPPMGRLIGPTFDAMLSNDWSRMSQYYIYTMLPFGRMIRDVSPLAKGNLIDNPTRLPEKLFGFPMRQLQTKITERNKLLDEGLRDDNLYPGSYSRLLDEDL